MNLQHTKTRNRPEPHRVEKLLYIQINKRRFRADPPPIITQEMLLEEEDREIERILQRKHVQDYLSAAFDNLDSAEISGLNSDTAYTASSVPPTASPTAPKLPAVPFTVPYILSSIIPPIIPSTARPTARHTVPTVPTAPMTPMVAPISTSNPTVPTAPKFLTASTVSPNSTLDPPSVTTGIGIDKGITLRSHNKRGKRPSQWAHGVAEHSYKRTRRRAGSKT